MCNFPGQILNSWVGIVSDERTNRINAALTAFRTYLNSDSNKTIRFYIDASVGAGHQASSANLMRRLCQPLNRIPIAGYGYAGTIEVYIDEKPNYPYQNTLKTMRLLLPELDPQDGNPSTFHGATVYFKKLGAPPDTKVN